MKSKSEALSAIEFTVESLERRLNLSGDTYNPAGDTNVGFNMVSFIRERGKAAQTSWVDGVQSMHDAGATEMTIAVYREVNHRNGAIKRGTGAGYDVIKKAAERAEILGMQVTINPIFEVTGEDSWRGDWNPDKAQGKRFQRTYTKFVRDLAKIGEKHGAERINVGSELVAIVNDTGNSEFLTDLIEVVDENFSGEVGYVANWSNFDSATLEESVWNHSAIDYLGVSAYFSEMFSVGHVIVDAETAGDPTADLVTAAVEGWTDIIDNYLIPTADGIRDGALPIIIQEFGVVPYNLAGANPWSIFPSETATGIPGETADPQEQHDIIKGLFHALDGRGDEIESVHLWTWSFESNKWDRFALDPSEGSASELAATMVVDFLGSAATPE